MEEHTTEDLSENELHEYVKQLQKLLIICMNVCTQTTRIKKNVLVNEKIIFYMTSLYNCFINDHDNKRAP